MSIFNCNITFKMVEGDSLASTKNKLISHSIIQEDWSIISPAKTRIAIQELNEEAKEVLGVSVQMFEEDGLKVYPNVDEFDRIDELKKIQPTQINIDNKEGIDFIYSQNRELESIGSKEEYSEYIKTIFPESKVQNIVYRSGETNEPDIKLNWEKIKKYESGLFHPDLQNRGLFFTDELNYAKQYGNKNPIAYLINFLNPSIYTNLYDNNENDIFKLGKYGDIERVIITDRNKEFIVYKPSQIYILGNSSDIEGFKKFVGKEEIKYQSSNKQIQNLSKEAVDWIKSVLPNTNVELQQDLIDGIANGSFNTVNELITLSEKYANKKTAKHEVFHLAFNRLSKQKQEEILNEGSKLFNIPRGESEITTKYSLSQQNEINYVLKSVDILQSDKAKQVFEKGEKNKWDLDKILTELSLPKEQRILIKELDKTKREEILVELLNNYNYTVEINVSKIQNLNNIDDLQLQLDNSLWVYSNNKILDAWGEDKNEYTLENAPTEIKNYFNNFKESNTNYYSNLTVMGGTNYIEQEIATPLIIPSIKGHAQFATDNGIGWFRSDEQTKEGTGRIDEWDDDKNQRTVQNFVGGEATKTRRILELQSDLFQKGRDKENLIENKNQQSNGIGAIPYTSSGKYAGLLTKIRDKANEVLGVVKGERKDGVIVEVEGNTYYSMNGMWYQFIDNNKTQNQFLQLLSKDSNWVTFFTKAIIQDSVKKDYEKILFPTGNTASKVEGHTTLEEFKKQKEDRIKELEKQLKETLPDGKSLRYTRNRDLIENEINQLKKELEDVEKNGFGALKPIYNFYENTVTNILKKQGFSPKLITDEYGNTWNEIDLNDVKVKEQVQTIKFQSPKLEYKGDLAIEEKIAQMMENTPDAKLPKTMLGRWIQSVRNFFRNLFKERTKIQQLLRNINQGIIPVKEYEMSPTDGLYDFTCVIPTKIK